MNITAIPDDQDSGPDDRIMVHWTINRRTYKFTSYATLRRYMKLAADIRAGRA